MNTIKEQIAEAVYQMLISQSFADWYDNEFMEHVEDGISNESASKDNILKEIGYMIKIR